MNLRYHDAATAADRWNGNISEWVWQQGTASSQTYRFAYDGVNRLTEALSTGNYEEKGITYDRNGNIKTLQRTSGSTALVDNLSYTYTGNRLMGLTEAVSGTPVGDIFARGNAAAGSYTYDANGNMVTDSRKSLQFSYNFLNLLGEVRDVRNNTTTVKARYTWLADGSKLRVRNGADSQGFDYLGSLTYNESGLESAQFAGGVIRSGNSQEINYFITDHLGSVRAIVNTAGTAVEQNDYYAFGAKHVRSTYAKNSNRFDFNGKEEQTTGDLKYLDYGARMYDPAIGRWFNTDPLAEKYYGISPYTYAANNPISFIDPDGRYVSPYYDINGNFLGVDEFGFTGDIYITDKETFDAYSELGIANSDIIGNRNTRKMKDVLSLDWEVQSKIYTHVLKQMDDIYFSNLYNDMVSISTSWRRNGKTVGWNDPTFSGRHNFVEEKNGQFKVTTRAGIYKTELFNVEHIQSSLGVHEYYGHGIKDYDGGRGPKSNHWKAYEAQFKHPTFKKLSDELQNEINIRRISFK